MSENRNTENGAVSNESLDIRVRVYPVKNQEEQSSLMAFADVTLGGCFAVKGIRVMNSAKGPFVSMPSRKGKDEEYHEICFPTTAQMRADLNNAVMGEFHRVMEQVETRQPPAQKTAAEKGKTAAKKRQGAVR